MRGSGLAIVVLGVVLLGADALAATPAYKVRRTFIADKDAPNPFGRSDVLWADFLTTGFATTSDDASYFLVNDNVVAAMPRWSRGPADARFAGAPASLEAGAHRVEYLHVEGHDSQFCVLAWQKPGEDRFWVIPPDVFSGAFRAKQTALVIPGAALLECRSLHANRQHWEAAEKAAAKPNKLRGT